MIQFILMTINRYVWPLAGKNNFRKTLSVLFKSVIKSYCSRDDVWR